MQISLEHENLIFPEGRFFPRATPIDRGICKGKSTNGQTTIPERHPRKKIGDISRGRSHIAPTLHANCRAQKISPGSETISPGARNRIGAHNISGRGRNFPGTECLKPPRPPVVSHATSPPPGNENAREGAEGGLYDCWVGSAPPLLPIFRRDVS